MTFEVGQIASLPIIYRDEEKSNIVNIVKENIKEELRKNTALLAKYKINT